MLVVMVVHDVKAGCLDRARRRIDGNTDQMAHQPGLVFRHVGVANGAGNRIVTITAWRHAEDRRAWDAVKSSLPAEVDPREVFEHVESFAIDVYDQRWRPDLASVVEGWC